VFSSLPTPTFESVGKILEYDARLRGGEPRSFLVDPYYGQGNLIKEAGALSDALRYALSLQPIPGKTLVLVVAVTADEYYGDNRNGDSFPENPVPGFVEPGQELLKHYHSFEEANNYMHHVNKDPNKRVGRVHKAFYNHPMHRVELIIRVNNSKAGRVVERIADGEYPAVSMGCKIKFDVCKICRNKSPSQAQYCKHLKDYMGQIYPGTNQKAAAYNPAPRFFDLSWVLRPADRTGYMLKKVAFDGGSLPYEIRSSASLAEYVDHANRKSAELRKASDITKIVQGRAIDAKEDGSGLSAQQAKQLRQMLCQTGPSLMANSSAISDDAVEYMGNNHTFSQVLSTLANAGILLTTPEFVKLVFVKMLGHIPPQAEQLIDALVVNQDQVFDLMAENPAILDSAFEQAPVVPVMEEADPKLAMLIAPWREKRSQAMEYMKSRLMPTPLSEQAPKLEMLHLSDPSTGQIYKTQRGHADDARLELGRKKVLGAAGTAGLLGAAYKVIQSAGSPGRLLAPLLLGAGGLSLMGDVAAGPQMFRTLEGEMVPVTTPFYKTSGILDYVNVAAPLVAGGGLAAWLLNDYRFHGWQMEQALTEAKMSGQPFNVPWYEGLRSTAGRTAYEHPVLTGGGLALGAHQLLKPFRGAMNEGKRLIPRIRDLVPRLLKRGCAKESFDGVQCPDVNFPKLAEELGNLLGETVR